MRPAANITVHDPSSRSNHPTNHLRATVTGCNSVHHRELAHLTTTHSSERTGRAPVGARGLSVQSRWRCQPPYTSESWCDLKFTNPVLATVTPRVTMTVMCRRCLQSTADTRLRLHRDQHGGSDCSHMVTPLSTGLNASLQTYEVPSDRVGTERCLPSALAEMKRTDNPPTYTNRRANTQRTSTLLPTPALVHWPWEATGRGVPKAVASASSWANGVARVQVPSTP
jgi:hypothetical protein